MTIIGFGYKAGVGKDESANYLCNKYGFTKRAFAGNLKDCCKHVFGLSDHQLYDGKGKQERLDREICFGKGHYYEILSWMSSSLHKEVIHNAGILESVVGTIFRTPRDVIQFVGTEIMRSHYIDYHIDVCLSDIDDKADVAIVDVRFLNEAEAVLDKGGFCVNVIGAARDMALCNSIHQSEVDLDSWSGWSAVLDNTETGLSNLHLNIDKLLENLNVR